MLLVLVVLSVLQACSSVQRVSADEFERALERGQHESAHCFTPIGVTGKRAYIEHWSATSILGERTVILWTPVGELGPEVLAKLSMRP